MLSITEYNLRSSYMEAAHAVARAALDASLVLVTMGDDMGEERTEIEPGAMFSVETRDRLAMVWEAVTDTWRGGGGGGRGCRRLGLRGCRVRRREAVLLRHVQEWPSRYGLPLGAGIPSAVLRRGSGSGRRPERAPRADRSRRARHHSQHPEGRPVTTPETVAELLTSAEVARLLNVSQATLSRWRDRGNGPAWSSLGGTIPRYSTADVARYVENRRHGD